MRRVPWPEGTVTFLFSDVEGSTQLLERHPDLMGPALARHIELFEEAVAAHAGVIFETVGDAVYAAFGRAADAIATALQAQRALAREDWGDIERIACRIAIHTGDVVRRGDHYFGPALFRCARLQSIGYGEQVLVSSASAQAAAGSLPEGASLRDMGEHRLKDLAEPEHVFMLEHADLREAFPPLKSIDLHPNNLPAELSALIGREEEVETISTLLESERLVVLTGPGGIGKTRLALAVAADRAEYFPNGTFVVDLAPITDADRLPAAIASTIGVGADSADPSGVVGRFLAERPMLLVIDNVEQIPGAGPALAPLLAAAPEARLLVTSRTPLRIRGERVVRVQPLAARSEAGEGSLGPGGELFVARATSAGAFEISEALVPVVADIVERLDGLPLAIEIAAARTSLFEPADLLKRLDHRLDLLDAGAEDLPDRQRTLRGTVAWSVDLLDESDRRAFAAMGIFTGGCTLDAAEAVARADMSTLGRLVDASLVNRVGSRLVMLETVREYALEMLTEDGARDTLAQRHAAWFRDWVVQIRSGEKSSEIRRRTEMQLVRPDQENVAAAVEWFLARGDGASVLRIARVLWLFWIASGFVVRGERWYERGLELSPPTDDAEAEEMLASLGEFPRFRGDPKKAIAIKERSLEFARRRGSHGGKMAATLHDLASLRADLGDLAGAREAGKQAVRLRKEDGSPLGIAHALEGLADVELRLGDPEEARKLYRELVDLLERGRIEEGETFQRVWGDDDEAFVGVGLAMTEHRLGNVSEAFASLITALRAGRGTEDGMLIVGLLEAAALMLHSAGQTDAAVRVGGALQAHVDRTGLTPGWTGWLPDAMRGAEVELGSDRFRELVGDGRRMAIVPALDLAIDRGQMVADSLR